MTDLLREIQLPVLVAALLLGAVAKLADRSSRGQGPAALLPLGLRRPFTVANGVLEVLLGAALLVAAGLLGDVARGATATLFSAGLVAVVAVSRRHPELGCGCFGGLSTTPVGWRTITRTVLFGAAAAVTLGLGGSAIDVLAAFTPAHGALLAVEVLAFALLSPELTGPVWGAVRGRPCEQREVPLARSLSRLRASDVWQANAWMIKSDEPEDAWRQGCWRMLRFIGRRDGRPVDVVFGVPLQGRRPAIRAVFSDAVTGSTLAVLGEVAVGPALPSRRDPVPPRPTRTVTPLAPAAPAPDPEPAPEPALEPALEPSAEQSPEPPAEPVRIDVPQQERAAVPEEESVQS
ncbi:MauE/DoxX family redox-associated membrane protein [Nocardiopsis sediminis]|uniref:MauE/DoxX family redox-associated membrane protein n=1 Tax=Nocardiopsis sediminis TaxID=1778267 RepID=A0ABV8FTX4_9ACTN